MTHEQRAQAAYERRRAQGDPDWSDLPERDRIACFSATSGKARRSCKKPSAQASGG